MEGVYNKSVGNFLSLNLQKLALTIFATPHIMAKNNLSEVSISFHGTTLQPSVKIINLGAIIDFSLSWDPQFIKTMNTVRYTLYRLRHFRNYTTQQIRKNLVTALIFPHFDYVSVIYGDLGVGREVILHRLLNGCVRYVLGLGPRDSVTPGRLQLGWLTPRHRRLYLSLALVYRTLASGQPAYLFDMLHPYLSTRTLRVHR